MNSTYWIAAVFGPVFLGWADCHTDEAPVVLGFVLIVGTALGVLSPRRAILSWAITGAPIPITETLVHYHLIGAPYPASGGFPFAALVAYVPAAIGVAMGAGLRRFLTSETA